MKQPLLFIRYLQRKLDIWLIAAVVIGSLLLAPLLMVFIGIAQPSPEWQHIRATVLPRYVLNTCLLILFVGGLTLLFAVPSAWFVAFFEFKGRRFWQWTLVLPLAIPTYVAAFTYYDLLDWMIPVWIYIRQTWGISAAQWAEQIVRYGLLIVLLSSVLYPYLFLSLRTAFKRQQSIFFEASRMLGKSPWTMFWRVGLPLARPAFVAGLSLIVMEVINEYGAVHFFGVPTLTEGIFRTWFGLGDRVAGLRLAGIMLLFVFIVLGLEYWQRRRLRFTEASLSGAMVSRVSLSRRASVLVNLLCCLPLMLGFLFPVGRLVHWAYLSYHSHKLSDFFVQGLHSLLLAAVVAVILTLIAFFLSFCAKVHEGAGVQRFLRSATLGYAIPGVVIAVGTMQLFGHVDRYSGMSWMLSGSLFAIGFAYTVRFMTVSYQPISAGMQNVCSHLHDASRMLGQSHLRTLTAVHWPLLQTTLLAGAILVFIDIMKELPLTLILRPAEFETLATYAFGFAKEGQIYHSALPCLVIISLGAVGLFYINRWLESVQER